MPRGHELLQEDTAATAEFQGQYGIHPNAEALLLAHQASLDPALQAALMRPVDAEATAELELSEIEAERGGKVIDAAVRGDAIVYVAEGSDGQLYKAVTPANENYSPPVGSATDAAARAATRTEAEMGRAAQVVNANIAAKLEERRAELAAQAGEELAAYREELQGQAEAEVEEAAAAEEEAQGESSSGGGGSKGRGSKTKE